MDPYTKTNYSSLYSSLYNPKGGGIYETAYPSGGASSPTQRMDFRLGAAPGPPGPPGPGPSEEEEVPLFERDIAGLPLWLFAVAFLGFSWARRRKKRKKKPKKISEAS